MINLENRESIMETIPHGSGINGDWTLEYKKGKAYLTNFYDCMNDVGMYEGIADFTLVVEVGQPHDFELHFHGRDAQYLNRKHMLREYLEDTFAYWLNS